MLQQLTLGNGGLMDLAHLLQQILFISSELRAQMWKSTVRRERESCRF